MFREKWWHEYLKDAIFKCKLKQHYVCKTCTDSVFKTCADDIRAGRVSLDMRPSCAVCRAKLLDNAHEQQPHNMKLIQDAVAARRSHLEQERGRLAAPPRQRQVICTLHDPAERVAPINIFTYVGLQPLMLDAQEVIERHFPECNLEQLVEFGRTGNGAGFVLSGEISRENGGDLGNVIKMLGEIGIASDRINLSGAHCEKACIAMKDLRGVNLSNAKFDKAILPQTDLSFADLEGASFRCANIFSAKLNNAKARNADFTGADLRGGNFRAADVTGASFMGANISRLSLENGSFEGVIGLDLTGAIISGTGSRDDVIWQQPAYHR